MLTPTERTCVWMMIAAAMMWVAAACADISARGGEKTPPANDAAKKGEAEAAEDAASVVRAPDVPMPSDPDKPVIEYSVGLGHMIASRIASKQKELKVYADGRVVVGDPFGYKYKDASRNKKYVPFVEGGITREEVYELMELAVLEEHLLDFDSTAEFKRFRAAGHQIPADANSASAVIRTGDDEHECWLPAVGAMRDHAPKKEFPYFHGFIRFIDTLNALRNRIIKEHAEDLRDEKEKLKD